jgi:lipopolysaccharide/colanic/teichoic acid biosynthesis glycosyltransferase
MKRVFDIISSLSVLIILSPILLLITLLIPLTSKGAPFFSQTRIGKNGEAFKLLKFRTMRTNSEAKGQITVGSKDRRVTKFGYFLRKSKLDELPQLINILKGEMSVVGPRPEVEKYVKLYSDEQRKVLSVRPGLTDLASIEYINENEILGKSDNPEEDYIHKIMPAKLALNLAYIEKQSFAFDLKLIFKTIFKIFK